MTEMLPVLMMILDPIMLSLVLIYAYSLISRSANSDFVQKAGMGFIFGLAAILAMSAPIYFADGVIFDVRNLIVGLSAAFFGIVGGLITMAIAAAARLYIGGPTASLAIFALAFVTVMGLMWNTYLRPRIQHNMLSHFILGVLISLHLFLGLLLPQNIVFQFLTTIAPALLLINIIGSIIIGTLLDHEIGVLEEQETLAIAAGRDPLTDLLNRRSTIEAHRQLKKPKRNEHGTAMICLDIDHFKQINDTHGHLLGDQVLRTISTRISSFLRSNDIFSRMGGDEFLILMPDVSMDRLTATAEMCCKIVADTPIIKDGISVGVTVSVGVAWTRANPDFISSLSQADMALYQAKNLGRNCVAYAIQGSAAINDAFTATQYRPQTYM